MAITTQTQIQARLDANQYRHTSRKLKNIELALAQGERVCPTKLLCVEALFRHVSQSETIVSQKALNRFLLKQNLSHLQSNDSLAVYHECNISEKISLYEQSLHYLKILNQCGGMVEIGLELITLFRYLKKYDHGTVRVSVHASRRKWFDADLYLLWSVLYDEIEKTNTPHYNYQNVLLYCCDYHRYRYILEPKALPRIIDLQKFMDDMVTPWPNHRPTRLIDYG